MRDNESIRKTIFRKELEYFFCQYNVTDAIQGKVIDSLFEIPPLSTKSQYMLKENICNIDSLKDNLNFIRDKNLIGAINTLFKVDDDLPLPPNLKKKFVSNEKVGFLVGAGISKLLDFPLWKELGYSAIKELYDNNKINYSEFQKILNKVPDPKQRLNIFHNFIPKKNSEGFYKKVFSKPNCQYGNPYDILVKFECLNLSSNIDCEFHKSLKDYQIKKRPALERTKSNQENRKKEEAAIIEDPVINDFKNSPINNKKIFQLHGSIKKIESTVLTTEDYLNAYYKNKEKLKDFLIDIFNEYTIIFLGYGLEEFQILEHIIKSSNNHYVLIGTYLNEMNLFRVERNYFDSLNITPIHYYLDFNGYFRLNGVLEFWINEITDNRKDTKDYYDRIKDIDEVID